MACCSFKESYTVPFKNFVSVAFTAVSLIEDAICCNSNFEDLLRELKTQLSAKWKDVGDFYRIISHLDASLIKQVQPSLSLLGFHQHQSDAAISEYRKTIYELDFTNKETLKQQIDKLPESLRKCIGGDDICLNGLGFVAEDVQLIEKLVDQANAVDTIKREWLILCRTSQLPPSFWLSFRPTGLSRYRPPNRQVSLFLFYYFDFSSAEAG